MRVLVTTVLVSLLGLVLLVRLGTAAPAPAFRLEHAADGRQRLCTGKMWLRLRQLQASADASALENDWTYAAIQAICKDGIDAGPG